ncbi:MAG: hypothetical protein PHR16_14065, partial [Methylovulum sp.]|nr:hypothetical protein [Methylovulum sp.]
VPEQMFVNGQNPGEAISAVKALQKANAQGQRIYHITPANQATTLPNIHHDPLVMEEIRNALNAGLQVITHTDAVSVPGWSGAGYIIFDADTGGGAFKIAGGGNGGVFATGTAGILAMFFYVNGIGSLVFLSAAISVLLHVAIIELYILFAEGIINPQSVFAGSAATLSLMRALSTLLQGLGIAGFSAPGRGGNGSYPYSFSNYWVFKSG